MEVEGQVTLSEHMYSNVKVTIHLCLDDDGDNSGKWWRTKACKKVKTSLELKPNDYGQSTWLQAGSHSFASRFKIPSVGYSFSQGGLN